MDPAAPPSRPVSEPVGSKTTKQTVIAVCRWTASLCSLRVTRDPAFRFTAGHYARLGLADAGGTVVTRPMSIASAPFQPHLDFLCTLVEGGELSSRLATCAPGDAAWIDRASYGFLTLPGVAPGPDLWMLATGTGIAPFLAMLEEPATWSRFERIVVVLSVRHADELASADAVAAFERDPSAAPGPARLTFLPVVTREPGATRLARRIPEMLEDGTLADAANLPIDVARSRVLTCGNPAMAREVRRILSARGFATARRATPGTMLFENYWHDRGAVVVPQEAPPPTA